MNLPHLFASPSPVFTSAPRLPPPRRQRLRPAGPGRPARSAGSARRRGRPRPQPPGAAAAALPRQGQVGHLAVHERRPQPGRHLGLQARAGQARRPGAARASTSNTGFFTDQVGPLMKSPFAVAAARPVAGRGSRRSSRTWPGTSTRWPSSTPAGPTPTTTRRPCSRSTPA